MVEHKQRLQDWNYVWLEDHWRLLWSAEETLKQAHPNVRAFEKRFIEYAGNEGIPLFTAGVIGNTILVEHAQWRDRLDTWDWQILGAIGESARRDAKLKVAWGGRPDGREFMPDRWEIEGDESSD